MNCCRTARADAGKEVEALEADKTVFMFAAVAREEDGAASRSVADAKDVALTQRWAVRVSSERVVVSPEAIRSVRNRVSAQACKKKKAKNTRLFT